MNKIKRKDYLITRNSGEIHVIFDTRTNHKVFKLNETAYFLWESCKEEVEISTLVDRFCQVYEVDAAMAKRDVGNFIDELTKINLLEII